MTASASVGWAWQARAISSLLAPNSMARTFGRRAGGAGAIAHATTPLSGNVAAARGAAVRNNFDGHGAFDRDWHTNHPGAWFAAGWGAGTAWRAPYADAG